MTPTPPWWPSAGTLSELLRAWAKPLLLPAWLVPLGLGLTAALVPGPPRVLFGGLTAGLAVVALLLTVLVFAAGRTTDVRVL